MFKNLDGKHGLDWSGLGQRQAAVDCESSIEFLGSKKMWIIEDLLGSQEWLCSMEREYREISLTLWEFVVPLSLVQMWFWIRPLSIKCVYILTLARCLVGLFINLWTSTLSYARSERGIRKSNSLTHGDCEGKQAKKKQNGNRIQNCQH
jgi:hypothetical protein